MNNIIIVTCETNINFEPYKNFKFFGVERGCLDLINKNIQIDTSISDFDNVEVEEMEHIKSNSKNFIKLDTNKDLIDGELAIIEALKESPKQLLFVYKPTYRMDMNSSILYFINKYNIKALNEKTLMIKLFKGKNVLKFDQYMDYTYVSFIPLKSAIITIDKMKYNIKDLELNTLESRAFSNEFITNSDGEITTSEDIIAVFIK